jgi:hypothetical protein
MSSSSIVRLPYLHDHHSHVSLYAALAGLTDLEGIPAGRESIPQALAVLRCLPNESLSLVTGWHTDRLPFSASDLADLPPILLVNSSLHGFVLTPSGLSFAERLWPELALHASDEEWIEHNLGQTFCFYSRVAGFTLPKLEAFMAKMESLGIGSLDDMTIASEEALELVASSRFSDRIVSWATPEVYRSLSPKARSRCVGVKIYLDGALGGRSASLDEPFLSGEKGMLLYSDGKLRELLAEIAGYKTGLSAHALGHRCIEQILGCLENLGRDGIRLPALRLEHLQFISLDQARRAKKLGVVLSMQPNFNSDSVDFVDRLIPRHRAENDPFRMLIDEAGFVPGSDLVFGSDGMPHGPDYALQWSLFPAYEGQRLSAEEFARGYAPEAGRARALAGQGSAFEVDAAARRLRRLPSAGSGQASS